MQPQHVRLVVAFVVSAAVLVGALLAYSDRFRAAQTPASDVTVVIRSV
jgi:hypothetical protein